MPKDLDQSLIIHLEIAIIALQTHNILLPVQTVLAVLCEDAINVPNEPQDLAQAQGSGLMVKVQPMAVKYIGGY